MNLECKIPTLDECVPTDLMKRYPNLIFIKPTRHTITRTSPESSPRGLVSCDVQLPAFMPISSFSVNIFVDHREVESYKDTYTMAVQTALFSIHRMIADICDRENQ
jgi:hypothetical protein